MKESAFLVMKFVSTRDAARREYAPHEVIKAGIAPDGGLFFPVEIPKLTKYEYIGLMPFDYAHRASRVISAYLTDLDKRDIESSCISAYSEKAFPEGAAPVVNVNGNYFLELYHGPTCAFKDMALQLMPHLLALSVKKSGASGDAVILVATSGDTGKAALEGFADVKGTRIAVFFPENGVSEIQKKQMQTQRGSNVLVCGVNGNFDDCQTAVKTVFRDRATIDALEKENCFFSSANSINFGRLVPQVAYYVSACLDMGEECNITVPTGNFGNILAAYMAKKMGAPIGKLVCASNRNNVLTDFFETGVYDRKREFYLTSSPSMDILVSSNLERLLWMVCGPEKTALYMEDLKTTGAFKVDRETLNALKNDFAAYYADETQVSAAIARSWRRNGYLIDTHTAAGLHAAEKYKKETGDSRPMLVVSTASPFKFAPAVCAALEIKAGHGFAAADALAEATGKPIPAPIAGIREMPDRFTDVIDPSGIAAAVRGFVQSSSLAR